MRLPDGFKDRMTDLLGESEAELLFEAIERGEAVKAFRVNNIKVDKNDFEKNNPQIDRKSIDFPDDAYLTGEEFPGSLPEHHSGAIYMQDISAMSTVHAVALGDGACVLDSCSAPGGKTTQLAAAVGERGVVVANEYDRKRCRILQGNVERMGCKNTVVCNLDTAVLAETYPDEFDLVLCDAPCSGEGMFRKNPRAIEEWSVENVKMCAERQREILENVAKCVRAGGKLVYSTCTFSLEENEENVAWFLDTHSDFELACAESELVAHTSDGIMIENCPYDMKRCRRIYPHRSLGEGQFIAVLGRRTDSQRAPRKKDTMRRERDGKKDRAELEALSATREFLKENLASEPDFELRMLGKYLFLSPKIDLPTYNVFAAGACVGEIVKGRIIPHHHLFSAFGREFGLKIELSGRSEEAERYLRGEEIAIDGHISEDSTRTSGWAAVLIDGCAVGGAKVSNGAAKNHYPKGLRK